MRQILLPGIDTERLRLPFFLAMEEYVAAHPDFCGNRPETDFGGCFFIWRVPPTVIFGRNQDMASEVNMEWCRANGVEMYRRKSGGGCVYADRGNLMISCILDGGDVPTVFSAYLERLAGALRALGLPAEVSGRNDVLLAGRKLSGNAVQHLARKSVVHGTLLYDVDFAAMGKALTPSSAKQSAHTCAADSHDAAARRNESKGRPGGVPSVRQRVINLKEYIDALRLDSDGEAAGSHKIAALQIHNIDELNARLAAGLGDEEPYVLDDEDIACIEEIERTYLEPEFLYGRKSPSNEAFSPVAAGLSEDAEAAVEKHRRRRRIEGVGEFDLGITTRGGLIESVTLRGDYFALRAPAEIDACLTDLLRGLPYPGGYEELSDSEESPLILHFTPDHLSELLS